MNKTFTYKAFGLVFQSDFEIPELTESNEVSDVKISLGKAPDRLNKITKQGVRFQASKNEFLLEVDQIAKYYVKNGNKIIVDLFQDKLSKDVRLFLLGSAFGALFLQRGLLPIHGSSIKFGNEAAIFTGISGVGKSTIAAHFIQKGFQALADDISVVDQELNVVPGFPSLKVWNDVLKKLEIENKSLKEIRPNIKKYHLPIHEQFYNKQVPLKNIIVLTTKNSLGFEIEELSGIKKFNAIKNNTYRYRFVQGLEKQQDHFQVLNQLLQKVNVYRVKRPQAPMMLNEFEDFLQQNIEFNV